MCDEDEMKAFQHGKPVVSKATTAVCKTCGKEKLIADMATEKRAKKGYKPHCRQCDNEYRRIHFSKQREMKKKALEDGSAIVIRMNQLLTVRWVR